MPRRLILEEATKQAPSDINSDSSRNIIGVDRSELSDIRAYRIGDHMKTIHWPLSSKTQELVVKEFAMNSGKTVYIFADLAAHYDTEDITKYENDINEYGADGVIESCLAAASRELQSSNTRRRDRLQMFSFPSLLLTMRLVLWCSQSPSVSQGR